MLSITFFTPQGATNSVIKSVVIIACHQSELPIFCRKYLHKFHIILTKIIHNFRDSFDQLAYVLVTMFPYGENEMKLEIATAT
jgi:hypothetical protein